MVRERGRSFLSGRVGAELLQAIRDLAVTYQKQSSGGSTALWYVMRGRILATLFVAAWPFTDRLGFESAMLRLGGQVVSAEDMEKASSVVKGESLYDTGKCAGFTCDVIVCGLGRYTDAIELSKGAEVPAISCHAVDMILRQLGVAPEDRLWYYAAILTIAVESTRKTGR